MVEALDELYSRKKSLLIDSGANFSALRGDLKKFLTNAVALNHVYKAIKWIRNLFGEIGLGHLITQPTIALGDNVQAGRWAREDMITVGNRFIERMYFK